MKRLSLSSALLCLALSGAAWADQPPAGSQPGATQPPGPGARGPRGGYGPGMMGGWDRGGQGGWDMMGGGWGMMGGPGMMGGWGWGGGIPDLTPDQRNKITAIQRDLRTRQFAIMDRMHDQWSSVNTYRGGKFDEQAARRAYDDTEKLRRQMFQNMLDAQKRMDSVLTPQQRQALEQRAGR